MLALPHNVRLTLVGNVLGGLILAGILVLAWRGRREMQEVRLLRAFRKEAELTREPLNASVAVYKAVARAKLQDPSPVLDRLLRKRHIVHCFKWRLDQIPLING